MFALLLIIILKKIGIIGIILHGITQNIVLLHVQIIVKIILTTKGRSLRSNNNNNNKRPLTPKYMPPTSDKHVKLIGPRQQTQKGKLLLVP